jgi:hypothetical protein
VSSSEVRETGGPLGDLSGNFALCRAEVERDAAIERLDGPMDRHGALMVALIFVALGRAADGLDQTERAGDLCAECRPVGRDFLPQRREPVQHSGERSIFHLAVDFPDLPPGLADLGFHTGTGTTGGGGGGLGLNDRGGQPHALGRVDGWRRAWRGARGPCPGGRDLLPTKFGEGRHGFALGILGPAKTVTLASQPRYPTGDGGTMGAKDVEG